MSSQPDLTTTAEPEPEATPAGPVGSTGSPLRRFWRRLVRQKLAMISLAFLMLLVLVAIFADLIVPYDPYAQDLLARNLPAHDGHLMGTDDLGRDIFSRMIDGTGITLLAPVIAVAVGLVLGVPLGLIAGYFGGWFDWLTSRVADALFALPGIILAMAVVAIRGQSTVNVMIAVGILFAPRFFRVMRGEAMAVRTAMFVDAAKTIGTSPLRIIRSHILPNVAPSLIVQCTILLGYGVLVEAALSFFGIGVQPPDASWGVVLRRTFDAINDVPFQSLGPGLAITLLILATQFLGDGMRDSLGKEIRNAK
ncbi:ABC transporter permease subunit [Epidermidibacterium keratini]|uniref:ABC transporter permease subunit n=1 Tax=Epidermidibacterium keratini TaxID=1891644 RepID=A0A7L4YKM9_9ACTN|nr:ABC transporter permease [Epidermidibacterium keratini]QHB99689.1 ABC transporter permease subunit [Epidermidibacterium keratini]